MRGVVYGSAESIRRKGSGILEVALRCGRRQEAGCPREIDGNIEQDADRVVVIADLERFKGEGAPALLCRRDRSALHKRAREDFDAKRQNKDNHGQTAESGAVLKTGNRALVRRSRHIVGITLAGKLFVKNFCRVLIRFSPGAAGLNAARSPS